MRRSINIANVQLDVRPAPTNERLFRAEQILCDAVELGAELVVLPELFNTGYAYTNGNFQRAEKIDGATVTWMKHTARRYGIHMSGSLLLLDNGDIFNAMLIVAPNGQVWRYDKSYPWGWERAYFRGNLRAGPDGVIVAETELGSLGMLVCWDVAHPDLWQAYAGQVDLMIVCSCPPQVTRATFSFPPDIHLTADQLGSQWTSLEGDDSRVFTTMVAEQAAWLGVPLTHSSACGAFDSPVPNGHATLLGLIPGAPGLVKYFSKAGSMRISTQMVDAGCILSATGKPLATRPAAHGEGFYMAEVWTPDKKQPPHTPQPPTRASHLSYFFSDSYLPKMVQANYQRHKK